MAKPKRIILIRHGQSEGNVDVDVYKTTPDYSIQLTELGKQQAIDAGHQIKQLIGDERISAYVSSYMRTRQTYQGIMSVIEENIWRMYEDPRLREQKWSQLPPGVTYEEILAERRAFHKFYYRIQNGESGADVYDRLSTFLETLYRDFEKSDYPENVLIVTHGMTLRIFLMRWFHWIPEEFNAVRNPKNCQFVVIEMNDDGRYELTMGLEKRIE